MHVVIPQEFTLERFFAQHEFSARYMLGASDVEPLALDELLALAGPDSLDRWRRLSLGYTETRGLPALRQEIAALYDGLDADDILICAGAEEAIYLVLHVLLSSGDHAVITTPCYQSLSELPRMLVGDGHVPSVPLDASDWSLDIDRVEAAMTPRTRVVIVNTPHSPTGSQLPRASLDRLVATCESRGITLFADEVYRLLEHDDADRPP